MKTKICNLLLCVAALVCLCGCSKENLSQSPSIPSLNKDKLSLFVGNTFQLKYSGGDCIWESDNPLIAGVVDGLVTAYYVGETTIHANSQKCKVSVIPSYTKYYDPYLGFGDSKDKVISYMSGFQKEQETAEKITFRGKNGIDTYLYTFENGKLKGSGFLVPLSENDYLLNYVTERYVPIQQVGNIFMFASPVSNFVVGIQIKSSGIVLGCVPKSSDTKSQTQDFADIFSEILNFN